MADWTRARIRIVANIAELRTWLIDGYTDDDDVRMVVHMLSAQELRLRTIDAIAGNRPDTAHVMRMAHERGSELIGWGWVWQV